MPSPAATRRWQRRFGWPVLLSTFWVVFYTGLVLYRTPPNPERSAEAFLFSSRHLSQPLGWLFLLALGFTLVGAVLKTYVFLAGH